MESDTVVENNGHGTSHQERVTLESDASFITPTKYDVSSEYSGTPRRSPRIPKPRQFDEEFTPDKAFRQRSRSQPESSGAAPVSPKIPNSKTTSTPKIFNDDCDTSAPESPNLEAICSNDSFVVPTSICKVLQVTPKKTPSKSHSSTSGSTDNTPNKISDPINVSGPSPYKSHRPKYLPKNIKLVKKKRLERNDFLQKVEEFDAQFVQLPSTVSSAKRPVSAVSDTDGDLMGTQIPLFVIFNPETFFVKYDEHSFDTTLDMTPTELAKFVRTTPYFAAVKEYRMLSLFLTVTSDKLLVDAMSPYIEDKLKRGKFLLDWYDLKDILVNFGLTRQIVAFESASYHHIESSHSPPQIWNLKFLFMMVGYSFPSWMYKDRLLRLLKFLADCLFEPILQQCLFDVVLIFRRVARYLLQNGFTPSDLVPAIRRNYVSTICSRFIVQQLSPDPLLRPLSRALAYRTLHFILHVENCEYEDCFPHIADLLADVQSVMGKTGVKDIYQLILICENLVATSPFDSESKKFLEKLADFAEHMSLGYTYFENLYFTETVTRLRTLSGISHF